VSNKRESPPVRRGGNKSKRNFCGKSISPGCHTKSIGMHLPNNFSPRKGKEIKKKSLGKKF